MTRRSEILDEGFQICAPDSRAVKDMQACRINDVTDFLAESIGNPSKADFQSLDDILLTGEELPPLLAFLPTLLSQNVCCAHEFFFLFCSCWEWWVFSSDIG